MASRYESDPRDVERGRIDRDLWKKLCEIVFEKGYLCYHDDDGCQLVLRSIVEALHEYEIKKK